MIANGHPSAMDYTPRQASAFAQLAQWRTRRDHAEALVLQQIATRGDSKKIRATLEELQRE